MKKLRITILAAALAMAGGVYWAGAQAAQPFGDKSCCADCCCCTKVEPAAESGCCKSQSDMPAEGGCVKHKKS